MITITMTAEEKIRQLKIFFGEPLEDQGLPVDGSTLQDMSGNPLLRFKCDVHESLEVVKTEGRSRQAGQKVRRAYCEIGKHRKQPADTSRNEEVPVSGPSLCDGVGE